MFAEIWLRFYMEMTIAITVLIILLWVYRCFLPDFFRFLYEHVFQAILLILVYALIYGQIGAGLGLPALFWNEEPFARFFSAMGSTLVLAMIGITAYYSIPDDRLRNVMIRTIHFIYPDSRPNRLGRVLRVLGTLFFFDWIKGLNPPTVLKHPNPSRLSSFLRMVRLPFIVLLALPAFFPRFFINIPHYAPVIDVIQTGEKWWFLEGFTPNVLQSWTAYFYSLAIWLSGLIAAVLTIKILVRISVEFTPTGGRYLIKIFNVVAGWWNLGVEFLKKFGRYTQRGCYQSSDASGEREPTVPRQPVSQRQASIATYFLFVAAIYFLMNLSIIYRGNYGTDARGYQGIAPGLAIFAFLGLLSTAAAFLRLVFPKPSRPVFALLVVVWITLMNWGDFSYRFENLRYPAFGQAGYDLSTLVNEYYAPDDPDRTPEKGENPSRVDPKGNPPANSGLIGHQQSLDRWKKHCEESERSTEGKPKLVIICVSGGATRAAYWSATVVDRLGQEVGLGDNKEFHRHVRLISGASGGMVGMSYYLKWLYDQLPEAKRIVRTDCGRPIPMLGKQENVAWPQEIPIYSLRPVVRYMALKNSWKMFFPRTSSDPVDRGIILEQDWNALRFPFTDFAEAEGQGKLPSLVFSSMTVEDGRRLLISNLDLHFLVKERPLPTSPNRLMAISRGSELSARNPKGDFLSNYSLSAIEFFKVFPKRDNPILLSTAARMSATFPYVSPAVNLPSEPPLRVVDAGYYDSYGVNVAASWIFQNRQWIREKTSGVLLVQVRDTLSLDDRFGYPLPDRTWAQLLKGLQFFSSPLDGAMQARYTSSAFRNDQEVAALSDIFSEAPDVANRSFFSTAIFELSANLTLGDSLNDWPGDDLNRKITYADTSAVTNVAMSWYLTVAERESIHQAIPKIEYDPVNEGAKVQGRGTNQETDLEFKIKEINNLQSKEERLQRIEILHRLAKETQVPRQRDVILKELARARNFERIEAIKEWWKIDHSKQDE